MAGIEAIARWILDNLELIITIIVVAGLAAALILLLPAKVAAGLVALAAGAVIFVIEKIRGRSEEQASVAAATPITLDFAGVSIRLPAGDAGLFCAQVERVAAGAFRTLHDSARAALGDVTVA